MSQPMPPDVPRKTPLWRRTWVLVTIAAIAGLAIGGAGGSSSGSKSEASSSPQPAVTVTIPGPTVTVTSAVPAAPAPAAAATTAPPAPAATTAPPAAAGLADGSFTATAPTGIKDEFGLCSGTARITNTSSSEKSAIVTFTLFKGGAQKGTLQGAAQAVGAGKTASVPVQSTDPCGAGPFTFEFQVDTEF